MGSEGNSVAPSTDNEGRVAQPMTAEEQLRLIRDRIPMSYLIARDVPGATGPTAALDLPGAVKDFADARWRLIDRLKAAEALNAELLEALKGATDLLDEWAGPPSPHLDRVNTYAFVAKARAAIAKALSA